MGSSIAVTPIKAAQQKGLDKEIYLFAHHLYKTQDYYRSISEYKRLLYLYPDSSFAEKSKLQIGRAYMAGGDVAAALRYWEEQLKRGKKEDGRDAHKKVLFGISLLDYKRSKSYRLRIEYIEKAFQQFRKLPAGVARGKEIFDFTEEWMERTPPDYRTPWVAGTLSALIPGSGSFYSGRYLEGTYAFFLTALFFAAARDAFLDDQKELGVVFGFFTLTFYGGNIYAAVNSVHKTNDKMDSDALLRLRKKHGIWFIPETDQHMGRF